MSSRATSADQQQRTRVLIAAGAFAALMVASLVVAVVFPDIAGGPTKDVPLSGLGETTDDGTSGAWLRAAAGFGLVAAWIVLLVFQLRKARRRRTPTTTA